MRLIGFISTVALSLTLVAAAPAFAQQEQHDQQGEQKAKPAQDEKKAQPEKATKQEAKPAARQQKNAKPEAKNAQQQRTQQAKPEQQAQHAAGRIPADRYKSNFGREHTFHVSQGDYGNHRFQYGGYSFGFVDAWPSNWLYTQDVFVVEINGVYYLCNPMYPGVNIALSFTM
jgi:hypothetical protein